MSGSSPPLPDRIFTNAPRTLLTQLTRLAQRQPGARIWIEQVFEGRLSLLAEAAVEVAVETGDPLGPILAGHLAQHDDAELLAQIVERCNDARSVYSVPVQEAALAAARQLLSLRRMMWAVPDESQKSVIAWLSLDVGNRLSVIGDLVGALAATREAVREFADLTRDNRMVFRADLALALHNLSDCLRALQRREEALAVTLEAVEIQREAARDRPDLFLTDVAVGLDSLGVRLNEVGRSDEALAAMREGLEIQSSLPPGGHELTWIASSRLNFGFVLRDLV